jgi:hypothetical protein
MQYLMMLIVIVVKPFWHLLHMSHVVKYVLTACCTAVQHVEVDVSRYVAVAIAMIKHN